jgi:transposase
MNIATVGLDLAKHWFQIHAVDPQGQTVERRRDVLAYFDSVPPCLVGIEACAQLDTWIR